MGQTSGIQSASLKEVVAYLRQVNQDLIKVDEHTVRFEPVTHQRLCEVLREGNPDECSGKLITYFSKDVGIKAKLADAIERLEALIG